jgi:CBS-domain-containing membrane protein
MRGLEPDYLRQESLDATVSYFLGEYEADLSALTHGLTRSQVLEGLRKQGDRSVADVVRPIAVTLRPQDPMLKAVYEMVSHNLSLIPIVEAGQVLGVVRSVDVLHELAGLLW